MTPTAAPPSGEAALVARCRAGHDAAWAEVYRTEGPRVAAFLRRMNGPTADVDDLVQQVFVEAFAAFGRFRGEARLSTWLYRIAAHVSAKHDRASGRHRRRLWAWAMALGASSLSAPDPSEQVEARGALSRIDDALARLKPGHRAVWVLIEVEGQSLAEVALALTLPEGTVRSRLLKARRVVADAVGAAGAEDAAATRRVEGVLR